MTRLLAVAAFLAVAIPPAHAHVLSGTASFYGNDHRGRCVARQVRPGVCERFNPSAMTAAHWTLPLGSLVRVQCPRGSVVVRINDRGPAPRLRRAIDLSAGAARACGISQRQGLARVRIHVLR